LLRYDQAQRKLNDTYTGGLGSFVVACMVTSMAQTRVRVAVHRYGTARHLSWNLGCLLLEFFSLYSFEFNYYHTG